MYTSKKKKDWCIHLSYRLQLDSMSRGLNSISRRTRSNWEAFYKSRHDEIIKNKKPHQDDAPLEHHHHLDSINIQDSDADDDEDYKLKVCKQAGKKIWTRKAGRPDVDSISIEDSDDDDDDYELKVVGKKRGTRTVERPHVDSISSSQDSDGGDYKVRVCKQAGKIQKTKGKGRGKAGKKREAEAGSQVDLMINMLVDSIWNKDDNENAQEEYIEEDAAPCTLPLKFQFDQDDLSPKTDHREMDIDIDIDSLFRDLELGLRESQTPPPSMVMFFCLFLYHLILFISIYMQLMCVLTIYFLMMYRVMMMMNVTSVKVMMKARLRGVGEESMILFLMKR